MNVIATTALMREREFAIQAHAQITNGNVTTANAFEEGGLMTVNVIARIAVMSQIDCQKIANQQLLGQGNKA